GPVAPRRGVRAHSNPVRMGVVNVVVGGLWVGAGDDYHAKLATASDEVAERVGIAEPLTAVMKGNRCRVIRDATARAQAGCVRRGALEVIEPELRIELAGVVLDEGELRPAHWAVNPVGKTGVERLGQQTRFRQANQGNERTGSCRGFEKRTTGDDRGWTHGGERIFVDNWLAQRPRLEGRAGIESHGIVTPSLGIHRQPARQGRRPIGPVSGCCGDQDNIPGPEMESRSWRPSINRRGGTQGGTPEQYGIRL